MVTVFLFPIKLHDVVLCDDFFFARFVVYLVMRRARDSAEFVRFFFLSLLLAFYKNLKVHRARVLYVINPVVPFLFVI